MPQVSLRALLVLVGLIAAGFATFALWPGIDLAVSEVFYRPGSGFVIAGYPPTEAMRMTIWNGSYAVLLLGVVGLPVAFWRRSFLRLEPRAWATMVMTGIVGPILMVDLVFKPVWGRARPADVTAFGGALPFTPPSQFSGACQANCSFVSGEMSGTTTTAICLLWLLWAWRGHVPAMAYRAGQTAIVILPLFVAWQRIAAGRHFLSDVVFAALFMLLIAGVFLRLMQPAKPHHNPA